MTYRPENDNDADDNLDAYYKRKQSVKHNQLRGEAEVLHDKDRDAEVAASNWKGKGAADDSRLGKNKGDVWDDSNWKDKPQHGRSD